MPNKMIERGAIASALVHRIGERRFSPQPRTNADRVKEVEIILDAMHAMTGVDPAPDADGPETALSDLIAHLRHYAHARGVDFPACVTRGTLHFEAELLDEEEHA